MASDRWIKNKKHVLKLLLTPLYVAMYADIKERKFDVLIANGHITMNAPDLVRSLKLSMVEPG